MPRVSIIIPCYNQANYLPETLDSVLLQTYTDFECVIVNDGSPDNTEEVAKSYCAKDKRLKYVYKGNGGLASARNFGIIHSQGEFVLPLDSDDLIAPTYLEKAVNRFDNYPETKLVYCKADKFGDVQGEWVLPEYHYETLIWQNVIFCSAMYRRKDYDETIGYNINMKYGLEDWDFWLSLLSENDVVYRIDEILFHYRIRGESMVNTTTSEHFQDLRVLIYQNHPHIYEPYLCNIVVYRAFYNQSIQYLQELNDYKQSYRQIQKSHAYRIGRIVVKLFSWIKRRIREGEK